MNRADTDWTLNGPWPYVPKWSATRRRSLHDVDEEPRDGMPIVRVHGNPTWSYVSRRFIKAVAGYRAIAMDQLGCGRPAKPSSSTHCSIPAHDVVIPALIDFTAKVYNSVRSAS